MVKKEATGYCGIGIYKPKREMNQGGLIRSARAFGANFVFSIGARWEVQSSSIKSEQDVPVFYFEALEQFIASIPVNAELVCVEQVEGAEDLRFFQHPKRAIYLLGSEDTGVPPTLLRKHRTLVIPSLGSLNVATAGTVILYDRLLKNSQSISDG
jgi:tRNA(Leu) C34 or U34 (ribose-2'-O)-methylase TrmL